MANMYLITDAADTTQIHQFSLPSGAARKRLAIPSGKQAEYFQLQIDDGGTGDTLDWGVRDAIVLGTKDPRDIDP